MIDDAPRHEKGGTGHFRYFPRWIHAYGARQARCRTDTDLLNPIPPTHVLIPLRALRTPVYQSLIFAF